LDRREIEVTRPQNLLVVECRESERGAQRLQHLGGYRDVASFHSHLGHDSERSNVPQVKIRSVFLCELVPKLELRGDLPHQWDIQMNVILGVGLPPRK